MKWFFLIWGLGGFIICFVAALVNFAQPSMGGLTQVSVGMPVLDRWNDFLWCKPPDYCQVTLATARAEAALRSAMLSRCDGHRWSDPHQHSCHKRDDGGG